RMQMQMVAQAVLLGGNVRVGLEDNIYLEKGVPATNAQLVERAVAIVELLGARVQSAAEARKRLDLAPARSPRHCPQSLEPTRRGQLFTRCLRGPQRLTTGDERTRG